MSSDMGDLKALLGRVAAGERLSEGDAETAFEIMMSGNATPSQMGAFLRMQFNCQRQAYGWQYPGAEHQIILRAGHPAGRIRPRRLLTR